MAGVLHLEEELIDGLMVVLPAARPLVRLEREGKTVNSVDLVTFPRALR